MSNNKNKIFNGALFLGAGAFVSKLLGALYRVPLTNLLGGYGLGLYQIVFPVYSLLLDFSGAGVPSALSSLIAKRDKGEILAKSYLKSALRLLIAVGLIGSLIMFIFSKRISVLQGNIDAQKAYKFLAPAVFFVAIISAFRGYFQGLMDMKPTAISQVIEQGVKVAFGIVFVKIYLPDIPKAVAGATFAITLSEVIALIYLFLVYCFRKNSTPFEYAKSVENHSDLTKKIVKTAIPVTLISMIIPFTHFIDSFLIVNLLGEYRQDATALYGILSGVCLTVVNLPVSLCYGVATVAIPSVSSSKTEEERLNRARRTINLTLLFSLPCALFCFFFSPFITNLLFKGLSVAEKVTAISLLRLISPCIVLLSVIQTQNAVLIGKDKAYKPVLSLSLGAFIKIMFNIILLKIPKINIYGSGIALIACYFVTGLINLIMIFGLKVKNASANANRREYAS